MANKDPNIVPMSEFKRPSDPGKQALAGVTDVITGLPIIAGAIGGAGEAAYNTYVNGEGGFSDNFTKSITDGGWQQDWFDTGVAGMDYVNKKLGINMPISTEDQIARLLPQVFIPVPGGFLGGVTAKGIKGAAGKAATVLSPAVRMSRTSKTPFADKLMKTAYVGGKVPGLKGLANKTNAIRAGTQIGVGTSIDQGIRALINNYAGGEVTPLMFSDTALYGKSAPEVPVDGAIGTDFEIPKGAKIELMSASVDNPNIVPLSTFQPQSNNTDPNVVPMSTFAAPVPSNTTPMENFAPNPILMEQEREAKAAEGTANIVLAATLAALVGTKISVHKWNQARQLKNPNLIVSGLEQAPAPNIVTDSLAAMKTVPTPKSDTSVFTPGAKGLARHALDKINANIGNRNEHITQALVGSGTTRRNADQLTGQMGAADDVNSMMEVWIKMGTMIGARTVAVPMRKLRRQFLRWDKLRQQHFADYVAYTRENIDRTRATAQKTIAESNYDTASVSERSAIKILKDALDQQSHGELDDLLFRSEATKIYNQVRGTTGRERPGLFRTDENNNKIFIEDAEIKAGIARGDADPEMVAMRKQLAEYADIALEMAEKRGVKSKEWGDLVRNRVRTGDEVNYHPGRTAKDRSKWYIRMAAKVGIGTSQGKILNQVGSYYAKNLEEGMGVMTPIDPFKATEHYVAEVLEHTNRSSAQWNMMERLTGIKIHPVTKAITVSKPNAKTSIFGKHELPTFIGRSSPDDPYNQYGQLNLMPFDNVPDSIMGKFVKNLQKIDPKSGKGKGLWNPLPEDLAKLEGALVIQRNGDYYVFDVSNMPKGFKSAMEFDARLTSGVLQAFYANKRLMTNLTTGKWTPFAPISATYNNQVAALNAMLREVATGTTTMQGLNEAFEVYKAGLKGTYDIFATRMSDDLAQILMENIVGNSKWYLKNPKMMIKMQKIFADRAKNTMLHTVQENTGRFASDVNAQEFQAALKSQLDDTVPYIAANFGDNVLPQFARIWKHLNESLHEGTAYGITLRKLGPGAEDATSSAIREARQAATDLVGDTRLTGSSVDWFHAMTPFSGAMIQAYSVLGRALKLAGSKRGAKVIATLIGIPTALEVSYNNLMEPDKTFIKPGDPNQKAWTYSDYYWNGFTASQRANNRIIFAPGKPPWEAILWPIVPELAMFRGMFIDAMEATMGLSGLDVLGRDAHGNNTYQPNHFLLGLQRTFNIPLNPGVKAILSGFGVDVQIGIDDLLSEEGDGIPFVQSHPSGKGEQITGTDGERRYVGDEWTIRSRNAIADMTGMVGTAAINMYEAFNSGNRDTDISTRFDLAFDSIGESFQQSIRITNPLFGGSLRNSPDQHTVKAVVSKTAAIEGLIKRFEQIQTDGGMAGTIPAAGNSSDPSRDPIIAIAASQAEVVKGIMKP